MTSDRSILERQMADVEVHPFTLDEFHRRRHRKQRNRRIGTVMGVVLLAAVIGGVVGTFISSSDDKTITADDLPGPSVPASPFVGAWESTGKDGSSQTMEIQPLSGTDDLRMEVDDAATAACAGAPSTLTGTGQVQPDGTLTIAAEMTCDDGSTPAPLSDPETAGEFQATLANLTFVHDPETDELVDGFEVVWHRPGAAPDVPSDDAGPVLESPSPFVGFWVVGREGQYFPDSLEIRLVGDEDLHEAVSLKAETPQCAGGPSTMSGTGRREIDRGGNPGLVHLVVAVRLTCDDGSTPVPQNPAEDIILNEFEVSYIHDPVTDELKGSLGSLFIRQGAELAQGDPMATVERMIDAVNARDADAYIDLFAPDGAFYPRGVFGSTAIIGISGQPISEGPEVRAWMAIQEAWDFEADVISCTADPAERVVYDGESDGWIDCEVAARWPKLSLEITDRWRFELRGARLVYWEPVLLDLDPSGRTLPLGYPGLEAWETWLEANHVADADRWLVPREEPPAAEFQDAEDPEREAALARLTRPTQRGWVIDGHRFSPVGLIPYDPAFADDIEASINDYLEEQ